MDFKEVFAFARPMKSNLTSIHCNCDLCSWLLLRPTEIFIVDREKSQSQLQNLASGEISATVDFTETALS